MKYPCPCCGYLMFEDLPGSYEICAICFWEDDISQLRFPHTTGANNASLLDAQKHYSVFGACEKRLVDFIRLASHLDVRESEWRPVDESRDNIEKPISTVNYGATYPEDRTQLYYWRPSYWRTTRRQ